MNNKAFTLVEIIIAVVVVAIIVTIATSNFSNNAKKGQASALFKTSHDLYRLK